MELPVIVNGIVVTHAQVEEISGDTAIVYIPATRFKMGVRMELVQLESETDHLFTQIDGTDKKVGDENGNSEPDASTTTD